MSKQPNPVPDDRPSPPKSAPPPPPRGRNIVWFIALIAAFFLWLVLPTVHSSSTSLTYSQFLSDVSAHKVKTVDIAPPGGTSTGTLTDGTHYTVVIPPQAGESLLTELQSNGVTVSAQTSSPGVWSQVFSWLLILGLPLLIFGWLFWRMSKRAAGGLQGVLGVGRSGAKVFDEERPSTTFADVAGYEGARAEIAEVVDFLRDDATPGTLGAWVGLRGFASEAPIAARCR